MQTLQKNAEANGYHNIFPVQTAIGDKNGETTLFLKDRWDWGTTTFNAEDGYSEKNSVKVPLATLDSFFEKNGLSGKKIDIVKIDIEGGEMLALAGMKKLIQDNPNMSVISEFLYFDSDDGYRYLNEWKKLGFSLYRINEKERKLVPQTVDEIVHTPMSVRIHSTNIFLKR